MFDPIELKIFGSKIMVVCFALRFDVKVQSIYHTVRGNKIGYEYSYTDTSNDLTINKHTLNDNFIDNFPIISLSLKEKTNKTDNIDGKSDTEYSLPYYSFDSNRVTLDSDRLLIFRQKINESQIKTHIVYSTLFSKDNELILDWANDAKYTFDDRYS
jgi:hypothetical protein